MPELPTLPTLDGPTLPPLNGGQTQQLVILLHGVGSDGDDLIGLAHYFQKVAPRALFISPHAPYAFDMAPQGFEGGGHQWFSLQDMSAEARLAGTQTTAPVLDAFIDQKLAETGLGEGKLALIGFSQGTMMALHVAPRRAAPAPPGVLRASARTWRSSVSSARPRPARATAISRSIMWSH